MRRQYVMKQRPAPERAKPGPKPPQVKQACVLRDDKTLVMLMLSEGLGGHSEILSLVDIDAWLTEHHPEVYTQGDGGRELCLYGIAPEILAPCLAACRAKEAQRLAERFPAGFEMGHLVDSIEPNMAYEVQR